MCTPYLTAVQTLPNKGNSLVRFFCVMKYFMPNLRTICGSCAEYLDIQFSVRTQPTPPQPSLTQMCPAARKRTTSFGTLCGKSPFPGLGTLRWGDCNPSIAFQLRKSAEWNNPKTHLHPSVADRFESAFFHCLLNASAKLWEILLEPVHLLRLREGEYISRFDVGQLQLRFRFLL